MDIYRIFRVSVVCWGYFMKHNQTRQYIHQGCCRGVGISYKRIKGENDATWKTISSNKYICFCYYYSWNPLQLLQPFSFLIYSIFIMRYSYSKRLLLSFAYNTFIWYILQAIFSDNVISIYTISFNVIFAFIVDINLQCYKKNKLGYIW